MSIGPQQRFKRSRPCPVCGGGDDMPRGHQKRCSGFASSDGEYVHCSREEHAVGLKQEDGGTFAHRMHGPCRCGVQHGPERSGVFSTEEDFLAKYDYRDERGNLLFQVVRLNRPGKEFRQRRPNGGDWIWQTSGCRRVLYCLPELLASDKTKTVYIVEGEKDADTLRRLGHVATTNPGGAGKWDYVAADARRVLAGREVVVIADADEKGRPHAATVAASLTGHAKNVRVVEPPLPYKDASEFLEAGGDFAELVVEPPPPPISGVSIKWATALAEPLPPVDWLCRGYSLPRACYGLIAGESYSGKSLWITDLALAIASGREAVGLFKAVKGKVLWFDYDGQGERITRTRLQRMARARGYNLADLGENFGYAWLPDHRLDDADAVDVFCRLLDGVSFAVFDSWRGAAPNTDEQHRGAVQKVGNTILRVIDKTGVTPLIVDHTIKPAREGKSTRSAMHDIHGSSAKAELAQWVVMFEKQEGEPVRVKHTKERMEARTMAPFCLEYQDIPNGNDPRWGLQVVHLEAEQVESKSGDLIEQSKVKVLQILRSTKRAYSNPTQIYHAVGGRKGNVLVAVDELLRDGLLDQPYPDGPIRAIRVGSQKS